MGDVTRCRTCTWNWKRWPFLFQIFARSFLVQELQQVNFFCAVHDWLWTRKVVDVLWHSEMQWVSFSQDFDNVHPHDSLGHPVGVVLGRRWLDAKPQCRLVKLFLCFILSSGFPQQSGLFTFLGRCNTHEWDAWGMAQCLYQLDCILLSGGGNGRESTCIPGVACKNDEFATLLRFTGCMQASWQTLRIDWHLRHRCDKFATSSR